MIGKSGKSNKSIEKKEFKIKINFQIGDEQIDEDLTQDLKVPSFNKITPQYLIKALGEDALLTARWNMLLNEATEQYENEKIEYEIWFAKKFDKYKKILFEEDGKQPSDAKINKMVILDPEYKDRNKMMNKTKKNMSHIKSIAGSFARKGDKVSMIASLLKFELSRSDKPTKKYNHIEKPN